MNLSDDFPLTLEREAGLPEHYPAVAVAFGMNPTIDKAKTKEAGHDVYKDVEFVKIVVPGDKTSMLLQPSNDSYRRRFPNAYASFQKREKRGTVEGMLLEQWPAISRAVAMTLYAAHIQTVEALAEVHDGNIDRLSIANARELRDKARAWLKHAKDGAQTLKDAAEKKQLQDQIAALQAQITELAASRKADDESKPANTRRRLA